MLSSSKKFTAENVLIFWRGPVGCNKKPIGDESKCIIVLPDKSLNKCKSMLISHTFILSFRALAAKRKREAAREEKRRQEILNRRREEQREATDRFQRLGKPREQLLGKRIDSKICISCEKQTQANCA